MITYADTQALVITNNIHPYRCDRCGRTTDQGASWRPFYDTGTDPQYVGFQCSCGGVQGMTRANILRRIREDGYRAEQW